MKKDTFKFGTKQKLQVIKLASMGVYLASPGSNANEGVLLPKRQVPEGTKTNDVIEVFLYRDSEDRPIATTTIPKLLMGQISILKVSQVTDIGAFLDWGLEKDLFLPFREQTYPVKVGDEIPVRLYLDKSKRLCATMRLYEHLSENSPYREGDRVTGIIYEILDNFGAFVVVDLQYSALIPRGEISRNIQVGETVRARIKEVREDGKLTLSLREKAHLQIDADAKDILKRLADENGFLPFHDKTPPEIIKNELGMSKSAFKRAVGRLLKEGRIRIEDEGISSIQS